MKKLMASFAAVAVLVGATYFVGSATGQAPRAATKSDLPHKIGLIDMGEVFKEYTKFKTLREDLTGEIQQSEAKAKQIADEVQVIQEELKNLQPESADFRAREKKITELTSEFEAFRKNTQRDLMRKEAKIYHTVYLEVADAVKTFSEHFHYTMILRFSREELDSSDPQKVLAGLNRQVVYHQKDDDITDGVIEFLNRPQNGGTARQPKPNVTQTGAQAPATTKRPATKASN